jgi:hypothetical protein
MTGADLIHCEENQVRYYKLLPPDEDELDQYVLYYSILASTHLVIMHRYDEIDPTTFKIQNIVEAQILFVGVPLKGSKVKMMVVLRALALLDCKQSMVSLFNLIETLH